MNLLDHISYASSANNLVCENGITTYLSNDFREMKACYKEARPNDPLQQIFDPDKTDIGAHDGFWLKGVDEDGQVVQLQAMRRFDLGEQTLAQHAKEWASAYLPPTIDREKIDLSTSIFDAAPIMTEIKGRVVYHGGFWLHKSKRGGGLTGIFPRLLMNIAVQTFAPDFIYGYQARETAYNGLGAKEGYRCYDELAIRWGLKNGGYFDKAIVWVEKKDFERMMAYQPRETFDTMEAMRRPL